MAWDAHQPSMVAPIQLIVVVSKILRLCQILTTLDGIFLLL
jgi:hypothetical protein